MYRIITATILSVLLLAFVAVTPSPSFAANATPSGLHGKILGIARSHLDTGSLLGLGNLSYHSGGSVQTGTHHTYAIYWGSNFSGTYSSLINSFFTNVAADSGKSSNVYYSDTQYYQQIGSKTNVTYSEAFGGSWHDTALPTTSGCTSTAGGPLCLSDAQIQQEVGKAIAANGWPTGLGSEYFVFLANGLSTCATTTQCAFSTFCAYHSNYTTTSGATVLYANMPYTGYNLSSCGTQQYPNGDPAADSTINVTSHEANETITDALGNAWYDFQGNENGDKCAWNFGSPTGNYNQTINGAHYYLQGEWSNKSSGCVWSGT